MVFQDVLESICIMPEGTQFFSNPSWSKNANPKGLLEYPFKIVFHAETFTSHRNAKIEACRRVFFACSQVSRGPKENFETFPSKTDTKKRVWNFLSPNQKLRFFSVKNIFSPHYAEHFPPLIFALCKKRKINRCRRVIFHRRVFSKSALVTYGTSRTFSITKSVEKHFFASTKVYQRSSVWPYFAAWRANMHRNFFAFQMELNLQRDRRFQHSRHTMYWPLREQKGDPRAN